MVRDKERASRRIARNPVFVVGFIASAIVISAAGAFAVATSVSARNPQQVSVQTLLSTSRTVVGERIVYPTEAQAKVTAAIISLPAGASTGWHKHGVPLFAHVLEGELTVDYGAQGIRTYRAGDSFIEAMQVAHDGRNSGAVDVRILAIYMAAEGLALSHGAQAPSR